MITKKTVYSMVDDFLQNEDARDRQRFYKYLIDEAILEYGGEDYVLNIMSIESEEDFDKLDVEEKKIFINAFIKANIVRDIVIGCGTWDYYIINEEYNIKWW